MADRGETSGGISSECGVACALAAAAVVDGGEAAAGEPVPSTSRAAARALENKTKKLG